MTVVGFVRRDNNGQHTGQLKTISIKADIDIMPNANRTFGGKPNFRALTQALSATGI